VDSTTRTVLENVIVGVCVLGVLLVIFLGNFKAKRHHGVEHPAMLVAFIFMVLGGTRPTLISLGAVDFGIIVDSTVIVVENIFRHPLVPR